MKRVIFLIALIVFALSFSSAQTKANDPPKTEKVKAENTVTLPTVIELDAELQKAIDSQQAEIERAELALELAKTKLANIILQIRMVKNIPLEYRLRLKDGKLFFEKPPDNK